MNTSDPGLSKDFFDSAYRQTPPWDIGAPQPDLLALLNDFPPTSPVLDVGCGTGELALALAQHGLTVLGVDLAEGAIAQARVKAANAAPDVSQRIEFRIADALHPALLGMFGTVVDSGFFHLFGPVEREHFAHELAAALPPGGRYYLMGFAIDTGRPNPPRSVRIEELQSLFTAETGWRVVMLRPAQFLTRFSSKVEAVAACFERSEAR